MSRHVHDSCNQANIILVFLQRNLGSTASYPQKGLTLPQWDCLLSILYMSLGPTERKTYKVEMVHGKAAIWQPMCEQYPPRTKNIAHCKSATLLSRNHLPFLLQNVEHPDYNLYVISPFERSLLSATTAIWQSKSLEVTLGYTLTQQCTNFIYVHVHTF